MGITLSDSAADRVKRFLTNRGKGVGLRLGVKTSGCSGMAYVLEFVDEVNSEDQVFDDKGVKVIHKLFPLGIKMKKAPECAFYHVTVQ